MSLTNQVVQVHALYHAFPGTPGNARYGASWFSLVVDEQDRTRTVLRISGGPWNARYDACPAQYSISLPAIHMHCIAHFKGSLKCAIQHMLWNVHALCWLLVWNYIVCIVYSTQNGKWLWHGPIAHFKTPLKCAIWALKTWPNQGLTLTYLQKVGSIAWFLTS